MRDDSSAGLPGGVKAARPAIFVFLGAFACMALVRTTMLAGEAPVLKYPVAAQRLLAGTLEPERQLDYSPLYLWVNAAARLATDSPETALCWLQTLLAAATAALVFTALRPVSRWLALAGAAAFALNPSVLVYQTILEPEIVQVFLVTALLLALARPGTGGAVAGALLGLSFLTRGTFLPFAAVVPLLYRIHPGGDRTWARKSLHFAAPLAAAVLLLSARNGMLTGRFAPVAANPGTVFFEGNNPSSLGASAAYLPLVEELGTKPGEVDYQHAGYRAVARLSLGRPLGVPEVNRYWFGLAGAFIADHPLRALDNLLLKARLFFHDYRRHDVGVAVKLDARLGRHHLPVFPLFVFSGLALAGIATARGGAWRDDLGWQAALAVQLATVLVFYASDRQRIAAIPVIIVLALRAAARFASVPRLRPLLLLAPLAAYPLFGAETTLIRREREHAAAQEEAVRLVDESRRLRGELRFEEAVRSEARALALAPGEGGETIWLSGLPPREANLGLVLSERRRLGTETEYARLGYARLLLAAGRIREAEAILLPLAARGGRRPQVLHPAAEPRELLGRCAESRGDRRGAAEWFRRSLEASPGRPAPLAHLHALTGEPRYAGDLARYFGDIDARWQLGRAFLAVGDHRSAAERLGALTGSAPEFREALLLEAVALNRLGRTDAAAEALVRSMRLAADSVAHEADVIAILRRWSGSRPADPEPRYYLGVALHQFGHFREALGVLEEVGRQFPLEEAVQEQVFALRRIVAASR